MPRVSRRLAVAFPMPVEPLNKFALEEIRSTHTGEATVPGGPGTPGNRVAGRSMTHDVRPQKPDISNRGTYEERFQGPLEVLDFW